MSSNTPRFRLASHKVLSGSGEPFLIHEDIFASLSGKACSIVNDDDSGPDIDLSCWNEATVERFVEYAYTGDYRCPDPTPLDTPTLTPDSVSEPELNDSDDREEGQPTTAPPAPGNYDTAPLTRPLTPLSQCFHAGPDPKLKMSQAETFRMGYFDPAKHDFESVFLTHAQIYTLARYLEIEALWTLALQRLMRTLINIDTVQPNWPVISNFADLVKFSYEKTSSSADPLRRITSQFAALNFVALQNENMNGCIKRYGEFASELMEKVCRRLVVSETDLRDGRKQVSSLKAQLEAEKSNLVTQQKKCSILECSEDRLKKSLADANRIIESSNARHTSQTTGGLPDTAANKPVPSVFSSPTKPAPSTTTGGLFATAANKPVPSTTASVLFGAVHKPAPTSGLFGGAVNKPAPSTTTSGLFGGAVNKPAPSTTTGSPFGAAANKPAPSTTTGSPFGAATNKPVPPTTTGSIFGGAANVDPARSGRY